MKTRFTVLSIISFLFFVSFGAAQDAQALYNDGVKLKNEKKIKEAIDKFKQAISIKPDYTEARYEWGWCQNDLKDYEGAIINLRNVRNAWGHIPKVHFELGYAFEKSNKTDSAISCYTRCLQLKKDYSLAFKQLGYIAYIKEDYANAIIQFKKYEEAAKTEITDYLFWYRKGFSYNAQKDFVSAKTALLKSLSLKKDYINTFLELGFACSRLKEDEEAISYYNQAIAIDPKSHVPYNGIAEVYRDNKKDRELAKTWYQKTLAINPTERKACFGMGFCLNSQGKYNDAIPYLRTAIEKEPTYTAAFVELGYSYFKVNRITEAIENLNKAISLNASNENSRYYLVLIYISQKNKVKAQQMVDELKALNSKHVSSLQPKVDAL